MKNHHDKKISVSKELIDTSFKNSKNLVFSILGKLPKRPRMIADIGSGWGTIAVNFALLEIKVIAIEPSKNEREIIKYLVEKYPKSKKYIKIIGGVAEKLPIPKNSIDLCILSQVLEHVDNPIKTFNEIARILKQEGFLHLSCPNYLFPIEQHYGLPYLPLMPKKLFSKWAIFLLKTFNILKLRNVRKQEFLQIKSFIKTVNYTTDKMITDLCVQNSLQITWSSPGYTRNLSSQIKRHWNQNPALIQSVSIFISLPIKIARVVLTIIGILPMKLEYLIVKLEKSKIK